LTWVSDGNEFRRLRVAVKAGEVVEVAVLAHCSLLWVMAAAPPGARFYHAAEHPGKEHRGHHLVTNGCFCFVKT
jgi:hypothetical protein